MASRYWILGSGNWSSTSHWSNSSGGSGGFSVPTSSDNVFIDSNSGLSGGTIVFDLFAKTKDFTSTSGFHYTLDSTSQNIRSSGSIILESGTTTIGNIGWSFDSTSLGNTITTNNANIDGHFEFIGVGGSWILQDNLVLGDELYIENGTFDANGYNVTVTSGDVYLYSDIGNTPTVIMDCGTWSPARSLWTLDANNGVNATITTSVCFTNQTKNTSTFSNQTKNTSTFSNQSKNSSSWTNQNKN